MYVLTSKSFLKLETGFVIRKGEHFYGSDTDEKETTKQDNTNI